MTPGSAPEPGGARAASPLRGRRVVVCRSPEQAAGLLDSIETLGGIALALPLLELAAPLDGGAALDQSLLSISSFDWLVLTSSNAVHAVARRCPELPATMRLAVVGPATARAALTVGWLPAFEPTTATAEALANELPLDRSLSMRVLAPLAELASDTIERVLGERGASVERVDAYRMATPVLTAEQLADALAADIVLLTSPSTADRLADCALDRGGDAGFGGLPAAVVIGPSTEAAAVAAGFNVVATADPHTEAGLLAALVRSIDA